MPKIMLNGIDYSSPTASGSAADAYNQANAAYSKANTAMNSAVSINSRLNSAQLALGGAATASGDNSAALGPSSTASKDYSVAVGKYSSASGIKAIASGAYSTAIGAEAAAFGCSANASMNQATAIGYMASAAMDQATAIGRRTSASMGYSTAIGANASCRGNYSTSLGFAASTSNSNSIQLGDPYNLSSITSKVTIITNSDERDKTDIEDIISKSVEFLKKVRVIRYVFNGRGMYIDEENLSEEDKEKKRKFGLCAYDKASHAAGTKKGERKRIGVSAQGVQRALEETFGTASYANLVNDNLFDFTPSEIPNDVESQLAVNYEGFIPFLIKAVQELDGRICALENERKPS